MIQDEKDKAEADQRYTEHNTLRMIPAQTSVGGIKRVEQKWTHKGMLRSEAYAKRYLKKMMYDARVTLNRKKGINV